MNPVRVGLIGYGYASKTFHAPLVSAVTGLALVAISTRRDPAEVLSDWPGVAIERSPQALLARADIDLVIIPTPNDTHHPLARAALLQGKHVVVDKPFTVTLEQGRELAGMAQARGRLLSVFHNRRWDADFLTLRHLLQTGRLGRIVHFESHFDRYRPRVRDRWREQGGVGTGLWYDLGPHLLDQALLLFGMPAAMTLDLACQRDGARTDDYFHAMLRYGTRNQALRVVLHAGTLVGSPGARLAVHGTAGSYVKHGLDTQEDALKAGARPHAGPEGLAQLYGVDPRVGTLTTYEGDAAVPQPWPTLRGDYTSYYSQLRDALLGAGPNPVPPHEALQVMALIEAGRRSAAEHREVAID